MKPIIRPGIDSQKSVVAAYKAGDKIEAYFDNCGWIPGIVSEVYMNYGFNQGIKYLVQGTGKTPFYSITSEKFLRSMETP